MRFELITNEQPPQTLYHYTSLEALVAIVKSRTLRASNIRFLNDRSESLRLKEDTVEILQERLAHSEDAVIQTVLKAIESSSKQSLFVASLSEKDDLLSQWRAYCPSGLGVSIGFSSKCLIEQWVLNPNGGKSFFLSAPFQRVRYYDLGHRRELEATIDAFLTLERTPSVSGYPNLSVIAKAVIAPLFPEAELSGGVGEQIAKIIFDAVIKAEGTEKPQAMVSGSAIAAWILQLSPFVKHGAFGEECEWRKLVSKDFRPMPGQQFRMGKSTLIPFVEIMLDVMRVDAECVPQPKYFIDNVVIGPTPTPELTVEAVTSLFHSVGRPEVIVRTSSIPFRDW